MAAVSFHFWLNFWFILEAFWVPFCIILEPLDVHLASLEGSLEEGYLFICDRKKDMIITGGENVYSAEVENTIMQFPGLLECAVIGVPSKKWGEAVHAFVVVRDGVEVREDEIIEFCRTQISSFKC